MKCPIEPMDCRFSFIMKDGTCRHRVAGDCTAAGVGVAVSRNIPLAKKPRRAATRPLGRKKAARRARATRFSEPGIRAIRITCIPQDRYKKPREIEIPEKDPLATLKKILGGPLAVTRIGGLCIVSLDAGLPPGNRHIRDQYKTYVGGDAYVIPESLL